MGRAHRRLQATAGRGLPLDLGTQRLAAHLPPCARRPAGPPGDPGRVAGGRDRRRRRGQGPGPVRGQQGHPDRAAALRRRLSRARRAKAPDPGWRLVDRDGGETRRRLRGDLSGSQDAAPDLRLRRGWPSDPLDRGEPAGPRPPVPSLRRAPQDAGVRHPQGPRRRGPLVVDAHPARLRPEQALPRDRGGLRRPGRRPGTEDLGPARRPAAAGARLHPVRPRQSGHAQSVRRLQDRARPPVRHGGGRRPAGGRGLPEVPALCGSDPRRRERLVQWRLHDADAADGPGLAFRRGHGGRPGHRLEPL